ncbi:N-acetyllactosaminide beta-1,3-N-acetylglucosaminyltransferase 2-like [Paramormyrops kingsleyae]|uniref:N-acetyllactosaminide beta-1,3-N-acetylglucosaminyltransferase 2-like n=1 Tax=Paramormyrops kingsleyae TaxID=1676925 RepID=UPI000CD64745|nr:N-acetyllactosaminide beta-1,3-N-acetylglucosaminyltransferase 2-like [Paramormyrops kingsleyae]XP_023649776.1 N-acetyllactosaminide beta-1,3-N-acetylglucosaminyltransferase 2-like [Paramormyrops kingsleyae]
MAFYRRCCMCFCLFLFLLVYLFLYVVVTINYQMNPTPTELPIHFVAPGVSPLTLLAERPFWNVKLDDSALWNRLQHVLDRECNPILRQLDTARGAAGAGLQKGPGIGLQSLGPISEVKESFPKDIQDFLQSMHFREYPLIIDQSRLCSEEAPLLLLAIKSKECNIRNREAIRETWGSTGLVTGEAGRGGVVHRVFLLGRQDRSPQSCPLSNDHLAEESMKYGDILQWDFRDTFYNLTLKDVLFWPWVLQHCPHARFIFKGDDDVFVRTPALLDVLQQAEQQSKARGRNLDFVIGDVINDAFPIRQVDEKYYIPQDFYAGKYPPYMGGGGVVYSGSLVMQLNEVSKRVHLFPIDDVFLGMCLYKLGIVPRSHPGFLTFDFPKEEANNPCSYFSILLVHKRSPEETLSLWNVLKHIQVDCLKQTSDIPRRNTFFLQKE